MNKEELAAQINGRQYPFQITKEEASAAKEAGLVVVYGESDDLMEFEGAIHAEVGAWEGQWVFVTTDGLLNLEPGGCGDTCRACPLVLAEKEKAKKIEAVWAPKGEDGEVFASWLIKTDIPHATFEVMEGDERYCCGIVFSLKDAS